MVEKSLDSEKNILFVTSRGTIEAEDMMKGVEFLGKSEGLPKNLKILEDATEAKIMFSHAELEMIMQSLKRNLGRYDSFRHAVVVSDPTNTAYAMLASMMINQSHYSLKVFSTLSAAEHWLGMQA